MISRLFRTKSIEQILADTDHPAHRLKKTLTAWDLTALGIGAIIGTGIFVLIGTAIVGDIHRHGAGPGIILSFVLSGLTCALAALCYAEFSTMIPGPAPGRWISPTMAVPIRTKMPVPMIAPMPSAVRSQAVRVFFKR